MISIEVRGGTPLTGEVRIEGGKTAAGFIVAAALVSPTATTLHRIPKVRDVAVMLEIARSNGLLVDEDPNGTVLIGPGPAHTQGHISLALAAGARASIIAAVALAIRFGKATTHLPGGCGFAPRPVDIHLRALAAAGASVHESGSAISIDGRRIRPFQVRVDGPEGPSLGGTITALLLSAAADGTSEIYGANSAPEATEVIALLRSWGVMVAGEGTDRITVTGPMCALDVHVEVKPDRIEAGTFAIAAAATSGRIRLMGMDWQANRNLWRHLNEVGVETVPFFGGVEAGPGRTEAVERITAGYFPLFPTDLHPQMVPLLALGQQTTSIRDLAFKGRVSHLSPLTDFGIRISPSKAPCCSAVGYRVFPSGLRQARGRAPDIRTGAAMVIAALAAPRRGKSVIHNVWQLERGYAHFVDKLAFLGARVRITS